MTNNQKDRISLIMATDGTACLQCAEGVEEVETAKAVIELSEAVSGDSRTLQELENSVALSPSDPEVLYMLAVKLFLNCQYEPALECGLQLVKHHRAWENGKGKATVLEFIKAMGSSHLDVPKYRRQLSNLLFV